jgi:signal transduction histidine kinase
MALKLMALFRPASPWLDNYDELRKNMVFIMALLLLALGVLCGALTVTDVGFPNYPFLLAMALIVLGLISVVLSQSHVNLARPTLAMCSVVLFLASMWVLEDSWLPFAGAVIVFVNAALLGGGGLVSALAIGAGTWWLNRTGLRDYPILQIEIGLAISTCVSWVLVGSFEAALKLSWEMERQTDQMLLEARDRQADLASVLKSLELTTALLEQANRKLYVAHRQAEEAQRLKEQFAANVSHELRTPLNLILGFSEMLYMSPDVYGDVQWPPTLRRDIYQIYRSSRHLLEMVDDILDLSRFELAGFTLNKEPTDIAWLLRGAIDITAGLFRDRPVKLALDVEPDLPMLNIDRTRIRQVILNLLSNARHFTEQGQVLVQARREENDVVISVSDTGRGIAAEKLGRIFEEFYQVDTSVRRTHDGAGLGLAISQRFVQAHEGRIWVESEEGKGSTFFFSLPIPNVGIPTLYPKETQSLPPAWEADRPRVAVVDADPAVAALVRRHVTHCDVLQVDSFDQLAQQVITHPVELIIQNITPIHDESHGIAAHEEPSELGGVPIIRCSLPSKAWLANELSVAACLNKPITDAQLLREINRIGSVTTILVVDDDRGFCQLIERMLSAAPQHFVVWHAYDGEEGLQAMRAHRPDLVLLDLIMPNVDGFEMLARKAASPEMASIPVIALSVTSAAEDALLRKGSHLTVDRVGGLKLPEILRCLSGLTDALTSWQHLEQVQPAQDEQQIIPADRLGKRG